ncbi:hypothetical protein AAC387_Pa12g0908 [Persea americana]
MEWRDATRAVAMKSGEDDPGWGMGFCAWAVWVCDRERESGERMESAHARAAMGKMAAGSVREMKWVAGQSCLWF